MLTIVAGLMAAAAMPNDTSTALICEVGRVALRDLPNINHNRSFDAYYAGVDPEHHDLLEVCPNLKAQIPSGFLLANDDARARAKVHVPPLSGTWPKAAFIYSINIPEIKADGKTAIVRMGYSCTGLCGAGFEAVYVRTARGWERRGDLRMLFVS